MTDGIRFDLSPRTEFADRLEADLLRAIGDPATSTSTLTPAHAARNTDQEHLMTITIDPPLETPTRRPRRSWMLASTAAALLVVVAAVRVIGSEDSSAGSAHSVAFTVVWNVGRTINDCPTDTTSPACAFRYEGSSTARFTGDVEGRAYQSMVWPNSDDFADRAVRHEERAASYVFEGTVAGCGTGQFLMVETVLLVSGPDRDWEAGTSTSSWQIVPDSGRGDLRTISGSGTSSGHATDLDTAGRSFTGAVTCTPPQDLSANEIIAPLGSFAVPTSRQQVTAGAGDLPNGKYRAEFSAGDLDQLEPDIAHDFTDGGAIELTLKDGRYTAQGFLPSGAEDNGPFSGSYQVVGNTIIWVLPEDVALPNSDGINVFEWSVNGDTLTFTQVDGKHRDPFFAVPYTKVV
jgi:hypothetical protein